MTSFGSHRRNTDRSLKVSISSYRHRSDLVRCGNGSGETTVSVMLSVLASCKVLAELLYTVETYTASMLKYTVTPSLPALLYARRRAEQTEPMLSLS